MNHDGQPDPLKGWIFMMVYWSIGAWVGLQQGYLQRMSLLDYSLPKTWYLISIAITAVCQYCLNLRYDAYGRKPHYGVSLAFSVLNGVFETMLFFAFYDLGRDGIVSAAPKWVRIGLGFTVFSIYNALIHAFFWLPMGFPRHSRVDASPFHKGGLPFLIVVSIVWLALYEQYDDIGVVCILHFGFNLWAVIRMALPPPWAKKEPMQETASTGTAKRQKLLAD